MDKSLYSFLGLAAKAGKVKTGEELVLKHIRNQTVHLVLVANDASKNTMKKICDKSSYYQVPCRVVGEREKLGLAIGKKSRVVLGITDKGFAERLITMLDQ
ncbi:YlxQ family RNA-binding protein [Aliibacillus thermotolerans]|uniref:YlxQ family RNA-binding protein n=1 Tax=Aliibacillus thermotolerans TaxID=1834418 RepID=A0ABW0U403_9BACI|nr:YlxQ family RNA-binding protein [Aliibacillus thermotolerans]MDA3130574.1 YlxQ family RNA-binding protein [Aliibacillus thermotolerans]